MKNLYLSVLMLLLPLFATAQEQFVRTFNDVRSMLYSNPNDPSTIAFVQGFNSAVDGLSAYFRYYSDDTTATNKTTVLKPLFYGGRWKQLSVVPESAFVGSTLLVYGTSHEQGVTAYGNITNYMSVAGIINNDVRYTTIITNTLGIVNFTNHAVSGTSLRFNTVNSTYEQASINKIGGTLPLNYTGTIIEDFGFNDGYTQYAGDTFSTAYLQAFRATTLRSLCDYWVKPTGFNTAVDSSNVAYGFSSANATNYTFTVNAVNNPFPAVINSDNSFRYSEITNNINLQFAITNWDNLAIFFLQNTNAGLAAVYNGTNQIGTISASAPFTTFSGSWGNGNNTDQLHGAILIKGLSGQTATINITNITGAVRITAFARIPNPTSIVNKTVILCTPPTVSPNPNGNGRDVGILAQYALMVKAIASELTDYPVFLADIQKLIVPAVHIVNQTLDPYHYNPLGLQAFATAVLNAKKVTPDAGIGWQNGQFSSLTGSDSISIDGDPSINKNLFFKKSGIPRYGWAIGSDNQLYAQRYDALGVLVDNSLRIGNLETATSGAFRVGQLTTSPTISSGIGSPEGVVTAPPGSIFLRTDGAALTTLYVKTSGVGNTGWTAK